MRLAELCGLCWDSIDFELNQITITRSRDKYDLKETTKTKLKRIIPMSPEQRNLFWNLMVQQNHPIYVFTKSSEVPVRYDHIYRYFRQCQKRAGFEKYLRFHDTRHTFATQFMMNGGSLFDLQKILGHTKIDMTMRYAHFTPEHLQASVKYMSMGLETNQSAPYMTPENEWQKESSLNLIS